MKYITEYRDKELAKKLVADIAKEARADKNYRLMEFCGGHTHVISRYGLEGILPKNVRMIHGPGCPVCVMPIGRIDSAIELALEHGVILCTYADTMRVPASKGLSLMKAKAQGGDIRMIYSAADCLDIARANPDKNVVFFAIGFETTTPATAVVLKQAKAEGLKNFFVFCNHVLTPPAMRHILKNQEKVQIEGFVGPAHVSTIIGSEPYETFAKDYSKPVVIAGFEPLDMLQSILMLIRQINLHISISEIISLMTDSPSAVFRLSCHRLSRFNISYKLFVLFILVDFPAIHTISHFHSVPVGCYKRTWFSRSIVLIGQFFDILFHFLFLECNLHVFIYSEPA